MSQASSHQAGFGLFFVPLGSAVWAPPDQGGLAAQMRRGWN